MWISPAYLPEGLQDLAGNWLYHPGWHFGFNIPAFLVVLILTVILVRGIRESARTNNMMVGIKLIAILIFVFAGHQLHPSRQLASLHAQRLDRRADRRLHHLLHLHRLRLGLDGGRGVPQPAARPAHRHHRHAGRLHGALRRGGRLPHRPGALAVDGGRRAPVVNALKKLSCCPAGTRSTGSAGRPLRRHHGHDLVILVYQLGQSRVWFSMSRDGLLPKVSSAVHPVFRTPAFSTWVAGFVVAIPSGLFDIGTLADLSNIGTLFAFVLVSIGVIVLRYREPERRRGFRVPFGPVIPVLSVIFCFLLMAGLPIITWSASSSGWPSAWSSTSSTAATGPSSAACPRPSCICISKAPSLPATLVELSAAPRRHAHDAGRGRGALPLHRLHRLHRAFKAVTRG
jgi:basic amino acid/polyamine antiporter, APA family